MKEKVGIGIIGTGFARKVQIPCFLECENAEVVSIASGHLENAESAAKEFDISNISRMIGAKPFHAKTLISSASPRRPTRITK